MDVDNILIFNVNDVADLVGIMFFKVYDLNFQSMFDKIMSDALLNQNCVYMVETTKMTRRCRRYVLLAIRV